MMIKTLNDYDITNKRILLRVDLNVPLNKGQILDNSRLKSIIPTINFIKSLKGKIILISHMGRPKGIYQKELSLEQIVPELTRLLNCQVHFSSEIIGNDILKKTHELKCGDILLLENTRFYHEEISNNENFSRELAKLGDIYCNDAFSASHRAHASTVGIAKLLPNCVGCLMKKEIETLEKVLKEPEKPLVAVIGGAKISTKLDLLLNLIEKVDYLIIGGGMANTFLFAKDIKIGNSLCEKNLKNTALKILAKAKKNNCLVILPSDAVVSKEFSSNSKSIVREIKDIKNDEMILDIGPSSCDEIKKVFSISKTVIWNGPMGAFELKPYDKGTITTSKFAAKLTKNNKLISVAGGGDTVSALKKSEVDKDFTYLSLAGGAFLEWMEGKKLPGIFCLL